MASPPPAPGSSGELLADLIGLGGAGAAVTEVPAQGAPGERTSGVVRIGLHRRGPLPREGLEVFDVLLSADPAAPRPWVGVSPERLEAAVELLRAAIARQPVAAAVAAQVLRMTLRLEFEEALAQESVAYSMLLGSEGFRAWRADSPPRTRVEPDAPRVRLSEEAGALAIRLNRPGARNAFDAAMRDQLCEALEFARIHPERPRVILSGEGPAFSAGGDLDEFGQAPDPGLAHLIRTLRSPTRLVHAISGRVTARLHGACIGAGIEVPAAAGQVTARPGSVFRLPEVGMGLIPGAGGTASIPRRIGRRRTAWMALSGADLDLATALAWGLVDQVEPA